MNFQIDHNVLGFLFFIFTIIGLVTFLLYYSYKDDKKKAK